MVRWLRPWLLLLPLQATFAEITITSTTVHLSAAHSELLRKLDTTFGEIFHAIASLAGPGITNSAAFSSTIGIQRQQAELPKLQIEPSLGIIVPGQAKGDERLGSFPLYAANAIVGFKVTQRTALQLRGFYLSEQRFPFRGGQISFQPYNLGVALTRQIKPAGSEWYNPAILSPLDFGYMHGRLQATFAGTIQGFSFDPVGDGSQGSAKGNLDYSNVLALDWNVYSLTSGLVLVWPFWKVFTARAGLLASLHWGNAAFTNTATGTMQVTASAAVGANQFKINDTATLIIRNTARFHPIPVSNQISLGFGLNLWGASINLDLVQNIQFNARAIVLQLGCWI